MTAAPPVLMPVARVERAPKWRIVVAGAFGGCVVISAVLSHFQPPPASAPPPPSRFGAGVRLRLEALRDKLAAGLVSLRLPAGDYPPTPEANPLDPYARREATSMAVAGLGAAKAMGSRVAGLDAAFLDAKAVLANRKKGSGPLVKPIKPNRPSQVTSISAEIIGLVLGGDPADRSRVDLASAALASDIRSGPLSTTGWTRAIEVRALLALMKAGATDRLGADAKELVQLDVDPRIQDCGDQRVSEAFAEAVKAGGIAAGPFSIAVYKACLDLKSTWTGDRTDLVSWTMRAWLAAQLDGGNAWFAAMLPELEKAPEDKGVVPGDFYGDPVSRTASALLVLFEGWEE